MLAAPLDWTTGALADGLRHYRAGEFFAAHEAWETVWLAADEPVKTFVQALIQIAAAFHHLQRGNARGAARLLRAALARLEPYPPRFAGVRVDALRRDVRACAIRLDADATAGAAVSIRAE